MKFCNVTIQMKFLQQYFRMILFVYYEVLSFESKDEIQWCYMCMFSTLSNGNRTEWSTIQGVIGRVISIRARPI